MHYCQLDIRAPDKEFAEIEKHWANTARMSVRLQITNGNAVLSGLVVGFSDTTSIAVNAVLERWNPSGTFTHIVSFNNMRTEGAMWAWERPHHVARGHWYRLTLTATVVRNGISEVVPLSIMEFAD